MTNEPLSVEQVDRELAYQMTGSEMIRRGDWDNHPGVQACAQHRLLGVRHTTEAASQRGGEALLDELQPLVEAAAGPNGWDWMFPLRVQPVDGKPTIVSHKGGNLFRGYIATWSQADFLVALANATPRILAALSATQPTETADKAGHDDECRCWLCKTSSRAGPAADGTRSTERVEYLGGQLFALSAQLKASGFLADSAHHAVYERVVAAFAALTTAPAAADVPEGMKPWHGGDSAPKDWNGGRVQLANGNMLHPYQTDDELDWRHYGSETGCVEPGCIVAYTPRRIAASPSLSDKGEGE